MIEKSFKLAVLVLASILCLVAYQAAQNGRYRYVRMGEEDVILDTRTGQYFQELTGQAAGRILRTDLRRGEFRELRANWIHIEPEPRQK